MSLSRKANPFDPHHGSAVLRVAAACLLLSLGLITTAAAQEKKSGKIILDIPLRQPGNPEDSKEYVTLVVRGMKKSRSGAT